MIKIEGDYVIDQPGVSHGVDVTGNLVIRSDDVIVDGCTFGGGLIVEVAYASSIVVQRNQFGGGFYLPNEGRRP